MLTGAQTSCFVPIQTRRTTTPSCQEASHESSHSRDNEDKKRSLSWLESPVDSERRPARSRTNARLHHDNIYKNDWRVERYTHPEPRFPDTLDSLTDAAWDAVAGTLYGKQRLDPNVVSNAMSSSLYGYRPVRHERDVGRIGIEIDGAKFLFHPKLESSGTAIRRVALELGAKLSAGPWEGFEDDDASPRSRPVAIYFNTIKQSLIASQELLLLKKDVKEEAGSSARYDNITILCLQQDNEIPEHMQRAKRQHGGLIKGSVDPKQGLILVIQPTDYNSEFRPPGPSVGAVSALQRLVARASVQGLPAVVVSPRFLAHEHHADGGWDQSGYQQSSAYGGDEPPKGPTPWLMRDFSPPVFSWVGCVLPLSPHHSKRPHGSHVDDYRKAIHHSRVVCTQSVMQEGHSWHMFAVREHSVPKDSSSETTDHSTYQYLASTKTSSGRPPKDIVRHIFNEWS